MFQFIEKANSKFPFSIYNFNKPQSDQGLYFICLFIKLCEERKTLDEISCCLKELGGPVEKNLHSAMSNKNLVISTPGSPAELLQQLKKIKTNIYLNT